MEKAATQITVKGRVQGVGFRWFTRQKANAIGVTGYVRNLYNGDVSIFAEGKKDDLTRLIDYVSTGPPAAYVKDVVVEWKSYDGRYDNFSVEH